MIVTMLEARVAENRAPVLVDEYKKSSGELPSFIHETFLLHTAGSGLWRIVTVWESREALDRYRKTVDPPEGVRMFRAAGVEPSLTVFEVVAHALQTPASG